jgi:hypothetical protein
MAMPPFETKFQFMAARIHLFLTSTFEISIDYRLLLHQARRIAWHTSSGSIVQYPGSQVSTSN